MPNFFSNIIGKAQIKASQILIGIKPQDILTPEAKARERQKGLFTLPEKKGNFFAEFTPKKRIELPLPKVPDLRSETSKFTLKPKEPTFSTSEIKRAIGDVETEKFITKPKERYVFRKFSKRPELGDSLGKYQVTEGELKTYGKRYLGKDITSEEFLADKNLQEKYMDNKIEAWKSQGIDIDNIIVNHRGGINAKVKDYQEYVSKVKSKLKPEMSLMKQIGFETPVTRGVSFQEIQEKPSAATTLFKGVKEFARETVRSPASVGVELISRLDQLSGKKRIEEMAPEDFGPLAGAARVLFGDKPVPSITKRIEEGKKIAEALGFEDKAAIFASGVFILGITGLDFTPFGGQAKNAIKALQAVNTVDDAAKILKRLGVADDLILEAAEKFARLTNEGEIAKGLESIAKIQQTTKLAKKELKPLVEEAKKMTEAEFVSKNIFETRLVGKEREAIETLSGKTFSEKLSTFYNQATKEIKPIVPKITERFKTIAQARLLTKEKLIELAEKIKRKPATVEQFENLSTEVRALSETLEASPFKELKKYVAKSGEFKGKLPEVIGGVRKVVETQAELFKRQGDDIVTELGFDSSEAAREAFEIYQDQTKQLSQFKKQLTGLRKEKAAIVKGERLAQLALGERRRTFKNIQGFFKLSDIELAKVRHGRDLSAMTQDQFQTFVQNARIEAEKIANRRQVLIQVQSSIDRLELKNTENLRKVMKLPTLKNMTTEQLDNFDRTLNQYKKGDIFLSVRKLQTVDRTDLVGVKTLREAKERLAKELNEPIENLNSIKVDWLDRYRYDTALAEKNSFYALLVDSTNKSLLNAEARYLGIEKQINELINSARASKQRGLLERIIPQDKQIFKYLESPNKIEIMKEMTNEEIKAAKFIESSYREMRDYLVQMEVLKKYRSDYITHIRRGFLEEWKEDGLLNAFKNVFQQYKVDQAIFNIIDDTGNILPLEKFFQFSMRRTGELKPTENVAKAFLVYIKAFEKKAALDAIVPKLDIYAHSLTPQVKTPRGLEFDRSLKNFVNEWINTKKGRTAKIVGIEQGGKADLLLRAGKAFTSLLDLGLNIPVGFAARFGENITNFIQLGIKNYTKGLIRARTTEGKFIANQYKNFIGRTPWEELGDASEGLVGKLYKSTFSLFEDATVKSNKTFLLGSLTEEELKSRIISPERLARLTREMGRYRVVRGAKSVVGATSLGGVLTQYKTWALPVLRTTLNNVQRIVTGQVPLNSREGHELIRAIGSTAGIIFAVKAFVGDDADDSFTGIMLQKSYRDAMTFLGSLNPKTVTRPPRLIEFITDFGQMLYDIIALEEYKTKPGLKGVEEFERLFTPRLVRQFIPPETKTKSRLPTRGKLPARGKLP